MQDITTDKTLDRKNVFVNSSLENTASTLVDIDRTGFTEEVEGGLRC